MKQDSEVKLYMQARKAGKSQKLAAAKAGMSERTGRKYEQLGKLPSQRHRNPGPGSPARIPLNRTGTGLQLNSNVIRRFKPPPCWLCSSSTIQAATDLPRS